MHDHQDGADETPEQGKEQQPSIGLASIVLSTLSAAFGVQSKSNQARDFGSGRIAPFIISGAIFTLLFVLSLVGVVKLVLSQT